MDQFLHNHADGVFDLKAARILTTALNDAWKTINAAGVSFTSRGHAEAARERLLQSGLLSWPGTANAISAD